MFETSVYVERRHALAIALRDRGIKTGLLLFPGNRASPMNYADNAYPFRQDSSFLYYFGHAEADLAAIMDLSEGKTVLFTDDPGLDSLVWTGPRPAAQELMAMCGADAVKPRAAFAAAGGQGKPIHFLPPYKADTILELAEILGKSPLDIPAMASVGLIKAVVSQREIKEERELAETEKAVAASQAMHRAVMAAIEPGKKEHELLAEAYREAYAAGGQPSFPAIVTGRGDVLHKHGYDGLLEKGQILLLDCGAESAKGYAGDLTSSIPVFGRFTDRQKAVYDIVLKAGEAAAAAAGPGIAFRNAHFSAARAITIGLKELGLMKGDTDEAVAAGAHACFFPHGIGHQMGLDVHDMESFGEDYVGYDGEERSSLFGLKSLRLAKSLKPGMVFTIEPGIYFIQGLIEAWHAEKRHKDFINYKEAALWLGFGGIRNEEDWLCTNTGIKRLGPDFDKSLKAVESYCGKGKTGQA